MLWNVLIVLGAVALAALLVVVALALIARRPKLVARLTRFGPFRALMVRMTMWQIRRARKRGDVPPGATDLEVMLAGQTGPEAEAAKARAEVTLMNVSLDKCHIAAPFNGRVVEQKAREQQFAQPGQPLLDILDDSVLELEFLVPSRWLTWLKNGYAFQVRIDETGKSYPAKITRLGAKVDPVSQSVKIVAAIDGSFPELIAGMSGKIALTPPGGQ